MIGIDARRDSILRGAAEWRDRDSHVRREAREALQGGPWSAPVVEAALDDVLFDLDEHHDPTMTMDADRKDRRPVLVVLSGNVLAPVVASAYSAAAAGASALLKSSATERALAQIVVRQFDRLEAPLAGTIEATYWSGGDDEIEQTVFARVRRVVAFGSDETCASIRRRSPVECIAYADAYSIALVTEEADYLAAAGAAARDVCVYDQRGCMSPQTIYVEGDEADALRFAQALARALDAMSGSLPPAPFDATEAATVAAWRRHLAVTCLPSKTHGLDTLLVGPMRSGSPEYIVGVEPFGPPTRAGLGRIVSVKPCASPPMLDGGGMLDTLGVAGRSPLAIEMVDTSKPARVCSLGEMQRPPFGYRPKVADFA